MKKGYVSLVSYIAFGSFLLMFILISSSALAEVCQDGVSATGCVCGHVPNSSTGYGQIMIGAAVFSCDNTADGLCPEDFADPSGFVGNCSRCADADCTGRISGTIVDENSRPIKNAQIIGGPLPYSQSSNLESNYATDIQGKFNGTFITGVNYNIRVTKDSYATLVYPVTVLRNKETTVGTLSVVNGTCFPDCTNVYGRCSAACDGVDFQGSDKSCKFYNATVREKCDNELKGTEVFLGWNGTNEGIFVECCGDNPDTNEREAPYSKYYSKVNDTTCKAKNLIKVEKIARYNGVPVRVIVTYWE